MFTTNEEDQREAAALQKRLQETTCDDADNSDGLRKSSEGRIPNVSIDPGAHKYVLMSAIVPGEKKTEHFVVSSYGAEYHKDVARPVADALERTGYTSIQILGGGRIALDDDKKTIKIYGYSYGFGLADHALSKSVVEQDARYQDFEITWSNDGY